MQIVDARPEHAFGFPFRGKARVAVVVDAQIDLGSDPEFTQRPEPFGVNGVLHLFFAVAIIVERARPEE